ncbi:MAG: FAD-binding protein [Bilophila wadsworthia]
MTASQTIRLETELLILGTGAAGCGAALAARQAGIRTLMVDKGKLESSGCLGGGNDHFIAVLNTDEPQDTIDDLVKAYLKPSSGYSEKQIRDWGEVMPAMVDFLEGEGVKLLHNPDGSYLRTAGRGEPAWYINIADGQMIKRLIARKIRSMGADVLDHVMITKLLKKDGRVVGAAGYNVLNGTFYVIRAAGVILALGNSCNRATANSTGNPYNTCTASIPAASSYWLRSRGGHHQHGHQATGHARPQGLRLRRDERHQQRWRARAQRPRRAVHGPLPSHDGKLPPPVSGGRHLPAAGRRQRAAFLHGNAPYRCRKPAASPIHADARRQGHVP